MDAAARDVHPHEDHAALSRAFTADTGTVYLGGFFQVSALIVALMLARAGIRRLIADPARSGSGDDESSVR